MGNGRRRPSLAEQVPPGLVAAKPGEWLPAWRRVLVQPAVEVKPWDGGPAIRITQSVKHAGVWLATFADFGDGADVRPGLSRLALIAGITEKTAGMAVESICRLGFMWQYVDGSRAGRPRSGSRGTADEFRLTLPVDILLRVPMLSPEFQIERPDLSPELRSAELRSAELR